MFRIDFWEEQNLDTEIKHGVYLSVELRRNGMPTLFCTGFIDGGFIKIHSGILEGTYMTNRTILNTVAQGLHDWLTRPSIIGTGHCQDR